MATGDNASIDQEFSDWRKTLQHQIGALDVDYKTWEAINEVHRVDGPQFRSAPHFWTSVQRVYMDRLILGLWAVTSDNDSRSLSLTRFLGFGRTNRHALFDVANVQSRLAETRHSSDSFHMCFVDRLIARNVVDESLLAELEEQMAAADSVIESLRGWRHKVLAHRDRAYLTGARSVAADFPLRALDIRETIDTCEAILRPLSVGFDSTDLVCGWATSIPREISDLA